MRTLERALHNWRRRLAVVFLALAAVLGIVGAPARASSGDDGDTSGDDAAAQLAPVDVLQVSGLVDAIVVDQIDEAIERASTNGAQALILQMNTRGSVVGRGEMTRLYHRVADAPVPVAIWIGPSGARLYGLPAQLVVAADAAGIAPGARIGNGGTPLVNASDHEDARLLDLLRDDTYAFDDAREQGLTKVTSADEGVPNIRNMVFGLNDLEADGATLRTAVERVSDEGAFSNEITTVRFHKLGLVAQMFHTAASPPVTYLFLVIGLCLLLFEFFTAGIGVAGVVGLVLVALGTYGLGVLPVRGWAVALLLFSMLAFGIDVQVGIPRFWTGVGLVSLIVSSWFLFGSADGHVLRPSWLTLVVGIVGAAITFITGMPSMVRTRFATPTIGREWMIGELGSALVDVNPDGVVQIGAARWRARTNRALDIKAGDPVRVIGIDGVTLEVEPEAGGARDYREHRGKSSTPDEPTE